MKGEGSTTEGTRRRRLKGKWKNLSSSTDFYCISLTEGALITCWETIPVKHMTASCTLTFIHSINKGDNHLRVDMVPAPPLHKIERII